MTASNISSTVDFVIPADSAQTVVMFLLSHKISFHLMTSNYTEFAPIGSGRKEGKNGVNSGLGSARESTVIESIYQKYIEENIEQTPPAESEITNEFGITSNLFKNGFKSRYGKPFYQLYMEKKMEYAAYLLRTGIRAVRVSERLGYAQPIKFSKMFQKYFGLTPKKYQMQQE